MAYGFTPSIIHPLAFPKSSCCCILARNCLKQRDTEFNGYSQCNNNNTNNNNNNKVCTWQDNTAAASSSQSGNFVCTVERLESCSRNSKNPSLTKLLLVPTHMGWVPVPLRLVPGSTLSSEFGTRYHPSGTMVPLPCHPPHEW